MLTIRWLIPMFLAGLASFSAVAVHAQEYPSRPIRLFANEPGGNSDLNARMVAQALGSVFGQTVIVENRGGAVIAAQSVANSPPDGYALLVTGANFWIGSLLQKMPFDSMTDFLPITSLQIQPNVLVVHPSLPVKSAKELIALAKANPGKVNYSSSGTGSSGFLAVELFNAMAGINIVHIPYKGQGAANVALLSGEVELTIPVLGVSLPHVRSGRMKALAITGAQPSVLLPNVPTVAASGVAGYETADMIGMFAPAKTPAAVINRLNQEIVRFINQPGVKEKFNYGVETIDRSPEAFAAAVKSARSKMGKLINDLGLANR